MLRRRDDLAEYARLVQELWVGNDSFHGYFRMSTKQFDYMFWAGVTTHFTSTNCVRGCACTGTYDVDVVRSVNAAYA